MHFLSWAAAQLNVKAFARGGVVGDNKGEIELSGNDIHWVGMLLAPNGEIELEGNFLGSPSTFLFAGEEIEIQGNYFDLTAYQDGVLAFSGGAEDGDDEGEIEFEGSNGQWVGMILAPFGEIELEGSNLTSPSTLIFAGEEAEIEGNNVNLTAMNLPGPSAVRLLE